MGEVDLGPRLAGDVLEMEQPGDGHRAQDFVEGIAAVDADGAGTGLGGEEGEVFGCDLEEADGFTQLLNLIKLFLRNFWKDYCFACFYLIRFHSHYCLKLYLRDWFCYYLPC